MSEFKKHEKSLSDRIKGYKEQTDFELPFDNYLIVELKIHANSNKLNINTINDAMKNVTTKLIQRFKISTSYITKDKIILIFKPKFDIKKTYIKDIAEIDGKDELKDFYIEINGESYEITSAYNDTIMYKNDDDEFSFLAYRLFNHEDNNKIYKKEVINNQLFKGKSHKLNSVISSYATMVLTKYFINYAIEGDYYFNSHIYPVKARNEAYNVFYWYSSEHIRNSKMKFVQQHYDHNKINGFPLQELLDNVENDFGIKWESLSNETKYGYNLYKIKNGKKYHIVILSEPIEYSESTVNVITGHKEYSDVK